MMEKSGTFLAILVLNVCILVLLSGTVIYHLVSTQIIEPITTFKIKPVPPPPKPPSHGGDSAKSLADPTLTVVPPPMSMPSIVVSATSTSFTINAPQSPAVSSSLPSLAIPSGSGMGHGTAGGGAAQASPFGSNLQDGGAPALVGNFYDLKQTNDNPPTETGMTRGDWKKEMERFVADDMNESDFSKYLKSPNPLSTNGFIIPEQPSTNAPTAFSLDNVKPNLWAIVYRAKASVPEGGRYRFVGFGDDLLYIRVNGKEVFDGGWQTISKDRSLHEKYPFVWSTSIGDNGALRKGAWFSASQGDVESIDILIGDWGGKCGFYLMLEKEGANYEMTSDKSTPKLPLFQLGGKLPLPAPGPEIPPLSDSDAVWPAVSDQ